MEPNKLFLSDPSVPRVRLAGKEWPVPDFSLEQNNMVSPLLLRHAAFFFQRPGESKEMLAIRIMRDLGSEILNDLSTAVYWALHRAHKEMTLEEFMDMPITSMEVTSCVPVLVERAKLFVTQKPGDAGATGKSKGASRTSARSRR